MSYLEDKNHDEEYVLTYWDSLNRIYDDVSELWGIKDNEISEDGDLRHLAGIEVLDAGQR